MKNGNNKDFIKWLGKEIKNSINYRSPRINIIKGVGKMVDNFDRGHADVTRMANSIKNFYCLPDLDSDV